MELSDVADDITDVLITEQQIQEKIAATRRFAFEDQDAPVIEAQQRIIDAAQTSVDPLTLAIDVGPVRYKQVLKKLIAAEQAS